MIPIRHRLAHLLSWIDHRVVNHRVNAFCFWLMKDWLWLGHAKCRRCALNQAIVRAIMDDVSMSQGGLE